MPSTRRDFLAAASAASVARHAAAESQHLDAFQIARSHRMIREEPTPNFFEGMLLGNGDIGLCITVRPDALGLHIGKTDSWDIRVSIVQDRVRQTGGRYHDSTDFDFMMRMGVWTENLSLPAVLNECFLQSYSGTLRLFPNTRGLGPAQFHQLRAAGAFLVSASWDGRIVSPVRLFSERGRTVRLVSPWPASTGVAVTTGGETVRLRRLSNGVFEFSTQAGREYRIAPL